MDTSQQLEQLKKQLSEAYIGISKAYMRMSKTTDSHTLDSLQSGIDSAVKQANDIRDKVKSKQKEFFDEWESAKKENPHGKSGYD